ncbi:unknown protein [Microcystis aeruginosa NIES-843]|uniref:Uncharacterized protein n=1 Tax=Microcystis aeruginosa (strain NIES-843 / IAM M-2473) TaxID=449447 RepID=B0JVF5_MICAN|nr:unknown protein [Microcystis aeruginosa NIES-843]
MALKLLASLLFFASYFLYFCASDDFGVVYPSLTHNEGRSLFYFSIRSGRL